MYLTFTPKSKSLNFDARNSVKRPFQSREAIKLTSRKGEKQFY